MPRAAWAAFEAGARLSEAWRDVWDKYEENRAEEERESLRETVGYDRVFGRAD